MGHTKLTNRGVNLKRLSDKMRCFVAEYPVDWNGTRAARAAGYKHPQVAAAKLLANPLIQAAIGKAAKQRMDRLGLTVDRIALELEYMAFRDPIDLCDENGRIVVDDLRKVPERIRRCIDGIKCKQYTRADGEIVQEIELKLVGKRGAIDLAMRYRGMLLPQQHEVKVSMDWEPLYKPRNNGLDKVEQRLLEEEGNG